MCVCVFFFFESCGITELSFWSNSFLPCSVRDQKMRNVSILWRFTRSIQRSMVYSVAGLVQNTRQSFSTLREDPELDELMDFLDSLKNFEKSGVPKGAGTDSEDGFDLGRMRRLMGLMGNPQSRFKVRFPFLHFTIFSSIRSLCSVSMQIIVDCSYCWNKRKRINSCIPLKYAEGRRLFCWLLY